MKTAILSVAAVILGLDVRDEREGAAGREDRAQPRQRLLSNTPIAAKVEDDSPDHERFIGPFRGRILRHLADPVRGGDSRA